MGRLIGGMPYLLFFIITLFFSSVNQKELKKNTPNRNRVFITALLVIVTPAIMAGLRSFTVGTDTTVYAVPVFNAALHEGSLQSVITANDHIEIGFLALAYIVSRFTNNAGWFLFAISFFIQLFVYLALYRKRDTNSIVIGEFIYLFLFFNMSLNVMRQSMAMAVLLLMTTYAKEKKYFMSGILTYFAYLFHDTALCGIILIIVFAFFDDFKEYRVSKTINWRTFKNIFFLVALLIVGILITNYSRGIIAGAINLGILSQDYWHYLNQASTFKTQKILFVLYPIMYIALVLKKEKPFDAIAIGVIDIIVFLMQDINFFIYRMACYFMAYRILSLSAEDISVISIFRHLKIRKKEVPIFMAYIVVFIYWYYAVCVYNQNTTLPYLFR